MYFPPCKSNIKRISYYDDPDEFSATGLQLPNTFILTAKFPVKKQNKDCSDSWSIVATEAVSYLFNLELSYNFIEACYPNNHNTGNYCKDWGCNGDSVYNALVFIKTNGTIPANSWSDLDQGYNCSRTNLIPSVDEKGSYTIKSIKNISAIDPNPEDIETNRNRIKSYIQKNPVITGFIVQQSLCLDNNQLNNDWTPDKIYLDKSNSPVIGYHYALIMGWGVSSSGIPYWICKNSWGSTWITYPPEENIPGGYWKHAMYPYNKISCVDISIFKNETLKYLPFKDRSNPLGVTIAVGSPHINTELLDINKMKNVVVIRSPEEFPRFYWIIVFITLSIICIRFFIN